MDEEQEYEVGYGRPPKKNQFRKGKSGNPKGRPKKKVTVQEVFWKALNHKVVVNGRNGSATITKLEAAVTQLVNKAAKGDTKALSILLRKAGDFPELFKEPLPPLPPVQFNFIDPRERHAQNEMQGASKSEYDEQERDNAV